MTLLRQAIASTSAVVVQTARTAVRSQASFKPALACHASGSGARWLSNSPQRPAEVADVGVTPAKVPNAPSGAATQAGERPLTRPAHLSREAFEAKKEEKFAKYEALLREKATKEGFSSVEEMREKNEEQRAMKRATEKAQEASKGWSSEMELDSAGLSAEDARVAADIRARVEAEAKRKMETGDFSSGPGGIKTLKDIIDVERIAADDPATITQLWTQYHTLKNKLSAVIPAKQYAEMVTKAREYPQFLLPLPRTIVGSLDGDTANVAPGERKDGYEMQYMEWGFLPKGTPVHAKDGSNSALPAAEAMTAEERELVERAPPSTVLFTPLAEYKLRQEYAQPVLVVSHFTDLALSKGIVLLRGEVTGAEEAAAAPTGVAAAVAASKAGETSTEKLEKLQKPLQSQGKLSQQDAQLLTVTMQRFYMPKAGGAVPQPGEAERQSLLEAFHRDQDNFNIDTLCKSAFLT